VPNYEVVKKFCKFRNIETVMPATYVSEIGGVGKIGSYINDCLSRDEQCKILGCKFAAGDKDPL